MDEYRFQRDVQIGSDIKTILADNDTDRLKLLRYFDKYEIDCEVIVIENLIQLKKNIFKFFISFEFRFCFASV